MVILTDNQCLCTYVVETSCEYEVLRNEPVVETVWGLLYTAACRIRRYWPIREMY